VLLVELNIAACHDASEGYDYVCFIIVVEELASRSCSLASVILPWDAIDPRMIAHLLPSFSRLHTFCVDRSHLPLNLVIWSRLISLLGQTPSWSRLIFLSISDLESQGLPYGPAPLHNCRFIIVKSYQVALVWYLVDLSLCVSQSYDCFPMSYIFAQSTKIWRHGSCIKWTNTIKTGAFHHLMLHCNIIQMHHHISINSPMYFNLKQECRAGIPSSLYPW
jgi:hypothetical protein